MAIPNGHEYENGFFTELASPLYRWGCTACSRWDDSQKIDRVIMSCAGRALKRQIEVQLTLCFDHAGKLDSYMKKERPSGRQVAEIFVEIEGRIGFAQAALAFDGAVRERFPNLKFEVGIFILRIKTDGSVEWFEPNERLAFLRQEHERMLHSEDRRLGKIVVVNGSSMIVSCQHRGHVIEYYAPFVRIVDRRLKRMVAQGTLHKHIGQSVSFYPSGHWAERLELAFSIRCED